MYFSTSIQWPYIPNQASAAALPSMSSSQRLLRLKSLGVLAGHLYEWCAPLSDV